LFLATHDEDFTDDISNSGNNKYHPDRSM